MAVLAGGSASAQTLPGPAQPGLLQKRFERPPAPKSEGGAMVPPGTEGAKAPPGAEKATFVLRGVVVEGATVFTPRDFLPLYRKFLGTRVSVKTVYDIARTITVKYTAAGYILCQAVVPPQKIAGDGIVRIRVIEGYVDKVIIKGDMPGPRRLLVAMGDKIRAARPLTLAVLERYLLLARDLPGATATGTLTPSATAVGAADLVFRVSQKPVDAVLSLDNMGSRYLGPWEMSGVADLNYRDNQATLQMATTPLNEGELKYGRFNDGLVIDSEGTRLSASIGYSNSHPGWLLKPYAMRADILTVGGGVSLTPIRSRARNLFLHGGFETKDSVADLMDGSRLYDDHLRLVRAGGDFDWVDGALGAPAVSLVAVTLSQGIPALGASRTGAAGLSRRTGHADFLKATLDATRTQKISGPFDLLTAVTGQWADVSLLSSEEFAYGGAQFGRGYDSGEMLGDDGLAAKAELRYAGPSLPLIKDWQVFGFYDIGRVWTINPLPSERKTDGGASAGVGFRSDITGRVAVSAELAKPLTHAVAARDTGAHAIRAFFSLVVRY
jgi:hemolysin activation/secretion protein